MMIVCECLSAMSITIDAEIEGEVYDQEFEENHTVGDEMVSSTCTDYWSGTACVTCD